MGAYGSPDTYPYDTVERKCPKCGNIVVGKYCTNCGTKIDSPREGKGCLKFVVICIFVAIILAFIVKYGSRSGKVVTNTSNLTQMTIGDTVSDGTIEFTLTNIGITDKIVSDWSNINYAYTPDSGNTIRIDLEMKNISDKNIKCADYLMAQAEYDNGKYKYSGGWLIKDVNNGFSVDVETELIPLEAKSIVIVIDIPQEVKDSQKNLQVVFGSKNKLMIYNIK